MFRFEEPKRNRYENSWTFNGKTFVKCTGPGPHSTRNKSPNLVVGLHTFTEIEKGIYRCQNCYKPTITREPYRPSYVSTLTNKEREDLRAVLANIRQAVEKMEGRILPKVEKDSEKREQQTKF